MEGDTKAVKEQLKESGGRFSPSLNHAGEKRAGWISSRKQADKVKELTAPAEFPALPEMETSKDNIMDGCCNAGNLKECPEGIAEREVRYMDMIRPGKALTRLSLRYRPLG